jgi:hypothetical protein
MYANLSLDKKVAAFLTKTPTLFYPSQIDSITIANLVGKQL